MNKIFPLLLLFLFNSVQSQNIDFMTINRSFIEFTKQIESSKQYFISDNHYQAKIKEIDIRLYESIGNIAVIHFKNKSDFNKLATDVIKNAFFDFKYCVDYNSPIVFNFHTSLGNKIRFNLEEFSISIEFQNSLSEFADSNKEFLPVFVCDSDNSYAYHTNLRCENLSNCKSEIKKVNIREAKTYRYRNICEVCASLRF